MDNGWDAYRNHIQEHINHNTSLLFQRFNYFLLATSFLMIAFVTIITSDRFAADLSNNYFWIALTIGIVGFLLSYLFSIVGFINARLIHDMGLFLTKVISYGNILRLPSFSSHVSDTLVPKHRFGIKSVWSVYHHTIAFAFGVNLDSPFAHTKSADYRDSAPHTWLTPMLIAYVWIIICSIIFLDCSCLLRCLLPPLAIAILSLSVGLVIKARVPRRKR